MQWFWNKTRSTPDDLSEEMAQHLEEKTEALIESGMSRRNATIRARRSLGNQALLQDRSYEVWQSRYLEPIVADFKYALRQLRGSPVFATMAVLILGMGIAANTSVFSLLYAITQRDLPVSRPTELATAGLTVPGVTFGVAAISYPIYEQLVRRQQSFIRLAAWTPSLVTMVDGYGDLRSRNAELVTGNFFDQLGVRPVLGRMLSEADDMGQGPSVRCPVVLSYSLWKEDFHGDRNILGRTITISQTSVVVVGVAPRSFEGLLFARPTEIFLPVHFPGDRLRDGGATDPLKDPSLIRYLAIGRLKPGISLDQADREINSYTGDLVRPETFKDLSPDSRLRSASLHALSGKGFLMNTLKRSYSGSLTSLQAIMAIVLFLCCVNVTGLQLARVADRRHEFAVRIALGANRGHLIRQSLAEALILSLSGAALAVPIAWASTSALSSFLTPVGEAIMTRIQPDWSVFAIAGTLAAFVTLVIGILPALVAGKTMPDAVLRVKASQQRTPMLAGRILVPFQIALSFLLVVVTGLLLTTLMHLRMQDTGYDIRHVVEGNAQRQWLKASPEKVMVLYSQMVHQLRTEPGIESAGITRITPMMGALAQAQVQVSPTASPLDVGFNEVSPGYFGTLQIALLSGRDFDDSDTQRTNCIVNHAAEQAFYHGRSAPNGELQVSARDDFSGVMCRIVGVVQDTKYADLRAPEAPVLYFPITSATFAGPVKTMVFLMRSNDDRSAANAYRRVMTKFLPSIPMNIAFPLRSQKNEALGVENLLTLMCVLFGALALPLCGVGMFGLLAARVEQRTTEIAVRLTMGASRMQVLRKILRESLSLLTIGLLAGVPLLLAVTVLSLAAVDKFLHVPATDFVADFQQHFLHASTRLDIYNVFGAVVLLTLVALIAGLLPGWRASRLNPLHVLRRE